jgi:hypothetical protein
MANAIWAEVYNASGVMQGIVPVVMAQVARRLDAASEFMFRVPTVDRNATKLLRTWGRVRLFWEHPRKGKMQIGGGVLLTRQFSEVAGSLETAWTGMDFLHELTRENTLRGLVYDDLTIEAVVADLVGHVPGWYARVDTSGNTSRRFDGQSILAALLATVQGAGLHLRLDGENRIEVGAFGDDCGVRLTKAQEYAVGMPSEVALIDSLTVIQDSNDILNWIEPVWGTGDNVLTLRRSTRTSPYAIQTTTGPNGRMVSYLEDAVSIAEYGVVKGVIRMTDAPYIATAAGGLPNAADVLYDWAATQLSRRSTPQTVYQIAGIKLDKAIKPGDKVLLAYRGEVIKDGLPIRFEEIDTLVWILAVTEVYDINGQRFTLDVSSVDEMPMSDVGILADAIIQQEADNLRGSLSASTSRYTTDGTLSRTTPLSIDFDILNMSIDVGQSSVRVERTSGDPRVVSVEVDGTEVIGGQMWTSDDADVFDVYFDDVLTAGTIQGSHTLTVKCLYGSGDVTVTAEVMEITPTT